MVAIFAISCTKKEGCTDASALNYESSAETDDGSCIKNTDASDINFTFGTSSTTSGSVKSIVDSVTNRQLLVGEWKIATMHKETYQYTNDSLLSVFDTIFTSPLPVGELFSNGIQIGTKGDSAKWEYLHSQKELKLDIEEGIASQTVTFKILSLTPGNIKIFFDDSYAAPNQYRESTASYHID